MQETINQRLKFLIESLGLSVRAFSTTLGAPASTTRNYLDKDTKPSSDYIERIVAHFDNVNLNWLVAGKGEPFLSDPQTGTTQTGNFNQAGTRNKQTIKGNKGNVIGTNHGTATQHHYTIADCEKERDGYRTERDLARQEAESLRVQLKLQESVIAAKEETITLLRASFNRPN